ncbi:MAG: hypothetical protein L3K00_03120 [Thermoplasmata archaeon]|nr:hypothetical protein [Thermoplasmata archaeon]
MTAVLLAPSGSTGAARGDVVVGGKGILPGVWGVPVGNSSSPIGSEALSDGDLLYATSIELEIIDAGTIPVALNISAEQFDTGTATAYVNRTVGNNTTLVPIQVSVRLNPQWSNVTVSLLPGTVAKVELAIPASSSTRQLELRAGNAAWELWHLTPTGSSLAGLYSTWGLDTVLLLESGVTALVLVSLIALAGAVSKRIHRPPKVPPWWPALWVGVPVASFFAFYVPTNQFLGSLSPIAYPFFFGVAAFPYLPRLFKNFQWGLFEGFRARSSTEAIMPAAIVPVVRNREGLRCAPETWREAIYVLFGVPLPEVQMDVVQSGGLELKLEPAGLPVTCPLPPWYDADVDVAFWFDARRGLVRTRHRFRFWRLEATTSPQLQPDGSVAQVAKTKRRWDPHVELGSLKGAFPPVRDIAEYLAGVRSVEQEAQDHEVDRLLVAALRGEMVRGKREASTQLLEVFLKAIYQAGAPADRAELERLVRHGDKARGRTEGGKDAAKD